ncbi:MAG: 16S rRNA (guanine(966)-N(2))-methyltransferase RsmD, partial [Acidobacteria bacterium ACB2]|nr:16S rRNA (guanine(966)-N(2))-methyltransferase RsmD [Acidobacteria bacterium ACB2]
MIGPPSATGLTRLAAGRASDTSLGPAGGGREGGALSLRITGGHLRGRVLEGVPAGVRPTASRVREALFSMVGQDLRGWSVLDAFGGTGLLALEAVSRGAAPVVVVERR